MGVDFSSRNDFTNLSSLAKVSVPVESIIPWVLHLILGVICPKVYMNHFLQSHSQTPLRITLDKVKLALCK